MIQNKIAIYPGTFDPITNGHIDLIERAARMFDILYVSVLKNTAKQPFFNLNERMKFIEQSISHLSNVHVEHSDQLLVHYAKEKKAQVIIRGLRAVCDFEYEQQMASMNYALDPQIETCFIMANPRYSFLSSTIIKEVARYGENVSELVPAPVNEALKNKFNH